jgi:hypothetical protein
MPLTIDSIEIHHYRFPLDPPFHAAWDPAPRRSLTVTLVRVRAGDFEGVGSGDTMLGFVGHEHLFLGQDPFAIERHVRVLDALQFHYGRCWPLKSPCGTSSARPPVSPSGSYWAASGTPFRSTPLPANARPQTNAPPRPLPCATWASPP